ncbi:hypothetical protein B0T22DRAFT_56201 [Podospora appendiculata]|uniref:Uncharacterized protein n=1 Tax=Podospora appendiculata TaxID=314037 RepID=A0AAE0XI90_9PEZI|nr:hypothetical protein B0T22DRAFT_56201 [Podospora appendiculata]
MSILLNPDIALLFAEHTNDVASLSALMRTCRGMNSLIGTHEQSIVKAKLTQRGGGGSPLLVSPLGTALSSVGPEREVLAPHTFAVVQELEMRARRIDVLFQDNKPLRLAIDAARPFKALPAGEVEQLIQGLKRACRLADRLGDCVAEVMLLAESEMVQSAGNDDDAPCLTADPRSTMRKAHLAQLAFLHALPALDLAYLAHLAALGGMAYANAYPDHMADPAAWEHLVAIKEVLLRQGTMALWAWFQPAAAAPGSLAAGVVGAILGGSNSSSSSIRAPEKTTALTRFLDLATAGVMDEIRVWDMGGGGQEDDDDDDDDDDDGSEDEVDNQGGQTLPPGLHMTLHEAFSHASGRAKSRARIEIDMLVLSDIRGSGRGGHEYE